MNIKDKQELIDRFNAGELEGAEREEFIRLMENDPALAEDVKLSKKMDDFFTKHMERVEMLEQLKQIHEEFILKKKKYGMFKAIGKVCRKLHPVVKTAACLIITLLLVTLLYLTLRPPLNKRLYSKYFEPYDGDYATRSVEEHPKPEDKYHIALDQYNNGHYEKSWKMFNELPFVDSIKIEVKLFKGISAMEINKYDDAISSFKYILKDNKSLYLDVAEWYLALCYLKISDMTEAKKTLTHIISSNLFCKDDAEEILKGLSE